MNNKRYVLLLIAGLFMLTLAACGGGGSDSGSSDGDSQVAADPTPEPAGDAAKGEELFNQTCLACHGQGGLGIEGLGKDMTTSEFIQNLSEDEFVEFLEVGRSTSDPENTTNVDMPPKGGNPALSDQDLLDIIAYIRTLQK